MDTSFFKIQPFDMKNIPLILEVVLPMWSPPVEDIGFRRFYVEHIIRNNYFDNDLHFQLIENSGDAAEPYDKLRGEPHKMQAAGKFCAMAFFACKTDICKAEDWFEIESKKYPKELLQSSQMGKVYIELMDKKTRAFMNDDDIQLTLYVSRKKGCGSKLLNELCDRLRHQGYKNLYLWTDCECNWQWYTEHGYELVSKDVYDPFSSKDEDYNTYIFRKKL